MGVMKNLAIANRSGNGRTGSAYRRTEGSTLKQSRKSAEAKAKAMALRVSMQFDGLSHIEAALKALPERVQANTIRAAMRKAAQPIVAAARALAPADRGTLENSITVKSLKRKRRSRIVGVSISPGEGWFRGDSYYAGFIEFGWKKQETYRRANGQFVSLPRGQGTPTEQPARPFLRPALDNSRSQVESIFRTEVTRGVAKQAAKLAREKLRSSNLVIQKLDRKTLKLMDAGNG